MRYILKSGIFFIFIVLVAACQSVEPNGYIRINQLGYLPDFPKKAVFLSKNNNIPEKFLVIDISTGKTVLKSEKISILSGYGCFRQTAQFNFSELHRPGIYRIKSGKIISPAFTVNAHVYDHKADFLLKYIRQQQCGYNPFFKDSCHTHDGFIVFHPDPAIDSTHIDVVGGWHDASDYLRYVKTSATTVFQLLFAYQQFPDVFEDNCNASDDAGANGIPDVLDEAKWGLDWLVKMNPRDDEMFFQVADDRDHTGFKIPSEDSAYYGQGRERPVYYCTGKPQGSTRYKNQSTGCASLAGKYASAFALGASVLKPWYPAFCRTLARKAAAAYSMGEKYPGVCQGAPHNAPYYYAEQNWTDDMELAAIQLYLLAGDSTYLSEAVGYGTKEPVSPWMGSDTANHYQWYPFVNIGHYGLAAHGGNVSGIFTAYMKNGLDKLSRRGGKNPFGLGVPFIWCSNNLVASSLIQCYLYRRLTGDTTYFDMENAMSGWLFGCNPWGTSMVVGLPADGDYPADVHSVVTVKLHKQPLGGLVDGPVYSSIFASLRGLFLAHPDEYAGVQPGAIIYHDDYADYSTNEPTLDGTASLVFYLAAMQYTGRIQRERTPGH